MAELVVEALEVIDVDQQDAERLVLLHRGELGVAEEFLQRPAVRQSGQRVGLGPFLGLGQGIADRVQLA